MTKQRQQETRLSQCSSQAQAFVLAQLTRNQYALDYWRGVLSSLIEMPIYRHELKRMYNIIQRELNQYNLAVRKMIRPEKGDTVDGYEVMLDNTAEFHDALKKQIWYYEQAISRLIQKKNLPHAAWLCKLATAKDILDLTAFCDGMEIRRCPSIGNVGKMGGMVTNMPYMDNEEFPTSPTVMGNFVKLCGKMNMAILSALGVNHDFAYSELSDAEAIRSIDIVSGNVIRTLLDYKTIMVMYEGEGGKTFEEAREISDERIREAEKKKAKKAKKDEHKEELKKAKKAAKNQ